MADNNFNEEFGEVKPTQDGTVLPASAPAGETSTKAKKKVSGKTVKITLGAVALAVVFFLVGWFGHFYSIDSRARTLLWLIDTIQGNYYQEVDMDDLYDELYDTVLPDQFCAFYTPAEYAKLVEESAGNNSDTGMSVYVENDILRVRLVIGNSPAAIAGVKAGMTIFRMGDSAENLKAGTLDDLYELAANLKGGAFYFECGFSEEDAKIRRVPSTDYFASYCYYRDSESSFGYSTVGNGLQRTEMYEPIEGLDDKTAYISLIQFDGVADAEFADLIGVMKSRNRVNLIIDLRSNGGGYLTTFQSIASHLLRNADGVSPVVATAKYRSGKTTQFKATGNDFYNYFEEDSKVWILADEYSASASECLIGALVDYGTVELSGIFLRKTDGVEAHSYGKGVMQSAFISANGSALRLTSAEIRWPVSGRSIHGTGVTESMGAVGIIAPLLPDATDVFLSQVCEQIR